MEAEVKYPRTYHLPWSPGRTSDDKVMTAADATELENWKVIVTEKMDGENTTMRPDKIHARSLDSGPHESRDWVRSLWGRIRFDIPSGYRICGENVYAKHSIEYKDLPSYFLVFSVWDGFTCLSWDETCDIAEILGLQVVPVHYRGFFSRKVVEAHTVSCREGYVVRPAGCFRMKDFSKVVGKYVRANHVQTDEHWMSKAVVKNQLEAK